MEPPGGRERPYARRPLVSRSRARAPKAGTHIEEKEERADITKEPTRRLKPRNPGTELTIPGWLAAAGWHSSVS
ncbi:hypothetical protein CCC_03281 [Paramagnetospirillum magnetotacticum MS-1]|uniref:Uncharacterized protein n=1 Tax=Paramagnetospirillum magnetotacticum MS-1 TaxID=272627 RepID=A0A0C2Z012_PARME|nr:hypothetical protein CCC_03281 [Paramagnetospirillum magnetotacticum MS-1]